MQATRARVIDQVSSIADHILFVSIFLIGAVAVVLLRLLTNIPSFLTLIVPLALMGTYAFIVWRTERYRLREDRAADNIYYLGFLFTVTTLMVALIRYGMSDNPDVNQIIGDLGVGLVTTIVGLVGRIFFGQLRQDPEEIEEQTRLMLSEVVEKTKAQILHTNEVIDDLHAGTLQILRGAQETLAAANDGVVASIVQLEKRIEQVDVPSDIFTNKLDKLFQDVEQSVVRFASRVEGVEVPRDLLSAKLDPVLSELIDAIGRLVNRLGQVRIDPDLLERQVTSAFNPVASAARDFAKALVATEEALGGISRHREELTAFAEVTARLGDEKQRLSDWSGAIAKNEERLVGLNEEILDVQRVLKSTVELLGELGARAADHERKYGGAAEELAKTVADAQARIATLAHTTEELANAFAVAMRELVEVAASSASGSRFA